MIAHAIARHLDAVIPGLVYSGPGVNVFVDHMPANPPIAVAVLGQPGVAQRTRNASSTPGVQVLVRGAIDVGSRPPHDMALAILDALDCMPSQTIAVGTPDEVHVIGCTADQDEPIGMGVDTTNRHEFSVNFSLRVSAPTTHRPAVNA